MRYPNLSQERELWELGYKSVAGIDEAGRGAWAGPVVAGAVILPRTRAEASGSGSLSIKGLRDSKLLSPEQRDGLYEEVVAKADWGVGLAENDEIDSLNILRATRLAMKRALAGLSRQPDFAILDAVRIGDLDCRQRAVIKGDQKVMSVAAASIIAKVTRDRLLTKLNEQYPDYGFDLHKGYGTKLHQEMLAKHGPSSIHRLSYKPLRQGPNDQMNLSMKETGIFETRPRGFKPKFEVVGCFCESNDKILLLHRQDHKPEGNTWSMPAGKKDKGEEVPIAMRRELEEETGIIGGDGNLKHLVKFFVRYPDYDFVYHIFRLRLQEDAKVVINNQEHKDYRWVRPKEALQMNLIGQLDKCIKFTYHS